MFEKMKKTQVPLLPTILVVGVIVLAAHSNGYAKGVIDVLRGVV